MKIGIAGVGVVGGALERWLRGNTGHDIVLHDPPRGLTNDLSGCEAVFVCVPVPTVRHDQDLSIVRETLSGLSQGQWIFIRSSVVPGTCDKLAQSTGLWVHAMPEFLTERVADQDVETQPIICGIGTAKREELHSFLIALFELSKDLYLMSNTEAELAKYMHNGNGTVKVAFNNRIYEFAQKLGADYEIVRKAALLSGYVSPAHTKVPGPDGKLGYGGKCFPKDMAALIGAMKKSGVDCASLAVMQEENAALRDDLEPTLL